VIAEIDPMPVKSHFLVVQLRQLGDVLLTTPIARILKEAYPEAIVCFWTEKACQSVLKGNPYIDRMIVTRRTNNLLHTFRLVRQLRQSRFDVLLDFMSNPRSAVSSFLSGTPMRISYRKKGRGMLYTHQVDANATPYAVDYKKSLLQPLGINSEWRLPEIFLTDEEKTFGRILRDKLLPPGRLRLITIDPSHRRYTRRWPVKHYAGLSHLVAEKMQALPVVLWGPGEEEVAQEVVDASSHTAVMAPATSVREMAALIKAADLHVGNCSAPRHIAVAVGTPSFTILGSTSSGWTFPANTHTDCSLGLHCQPCNRNECPINVQCLTDLLPEDVFEQLSVWTHTNLGWTVV